MREIFENEEELIKQAQQIILEKTSVLDEETRSKVYSKLQAIKFYQVNMEEARQFGVSFSTAAFYANTTNAVYLVEGKNALPKLSVLTHELLHAVSTKGLINGFFFGLMYGVEAFSQIFYRYNAITEGITELTACNFLGISETQTAYFDFVAIANYLCESLGTDKVLHHYFNSDLDGFKTTIRKHYHLLDNYLIDKLFFLMDKRYDELDNTVLIHNSAYAKRCQEILIEMEMNKALFEHRNEIKNTDDIFKYVDLKSIHDKINIGLCKHFNKKITHDKYDKEIMIDDFMSLDDYENKHVDIYNVLVSAFSKKDNSLIENLSPKEIVMMTDLLNSKFTFSLSQDGGMPLNFRKNIYKSTLNKLCDDNGKISLKSFSISEKYDFITNILYNSLGETTFEYFYPKDLVWYTNHNNLARYKKLYSASFVAYVYDHFEEMTGDVPDQYKKVYKNLKDARAQIDAKNANNNNEENTKAEENEQLSNEEDQSKIA